MTAGAVENVVGGLLALGLLVHLVLSLLRPER